MQLESRGLKMGKPHTRWPLHLLLLGALVGCVAGMLWWAGLVVAFGPSTEVTIGSRGFEQRKITVLSRLVYAPLVALPWAVVGVVAGGATAGVRGPWVPVATALGLFAGGVYSLANSPFDGWLAITMPIWCLGGALGGIAVGALAGSIWRTRLV